MCCAKVALALYLSTILIHLFLQTMSLDSSNFELVAPVRLRTVGGGRTVGSSGDGVAVAVGGAPPQQAPPLMAVSNLLSPLQEPSSSLLVVAALVLPFRPLAHSG